MPNCVPGTHQPVLTLLSPERPGAADRDGATPVAIALSEQELGSRVAKNRESSAVGRVAQPRACRTPATFATGRQSTLLASYQCSQG